jgi:hypothetical protein
MNQSYFFVSKELEDMGIADGFIGPAAFECFYVRGELGLSLVDTADRSQTHDFVSSGTSDFPIASLSFAASAFVTSVQVGFFRSSVCVCATLHHATNRQKFLQAISLN